MSGINNGNVLFLDDDSFLVKIYEEKFAELKCNFRYAHTVDDCLRILRGGYVPDILIVDLEIPEKDGFAFLTAIREQHLAQGAHIMVLTNHADEKDKVRSGELGAQTYIIKATMIPDEVVKMALDAIGKKAA